MATTAFVPAFTKSMATARLAVSLPTTSQLRMAIDYNDPVVAGEFAVVQPMSFDDVESELREKGIRVPPTMK